VKFITSPGGFGGPPPDFLSSAFFSGAFFSGGGFLSFGSFGSKGGG
jgi:hypothetical protein